MDETLTTVGITLGAETAILAAALRWTWGRLTARFERDEADMMELKDKYEECLADKQEFAAQVARFEERTESMKNEIGRMRAMLEAHVVPPAPKPKRTSR